jgi:hypothetical protein
VLKHQAEATAQRFLDEHASSLPDDRRTLGRALDDFIAHSERERRLRASTTAEYWRIAKRLCALPWHGELTWQERPLDTFIGDDLVALRAELVDAGRNASTVNHYRRIVRGAVGTRANSPALAWEWMSAKVESEGKLRFYDPAQLARLKGNAHSPLDVAIYTLAAEGLGHEIGWRPACLQPRLAERRARVLPARQPVAQQPDRMLLRLAIVLGRETDRAVQIPLSLHRPLGGRDQRPRTAAAGRRLRPSAPGTR